MANTGYKINPQVIQVFTTGPNSGSVVSNDFTIIFSGSFTSSFVCNEFTFENKVYDPVNCVVPGLCIPPTLTNLTLSGSCEDFGGFIYNIQYDNNNSPYSSQSRIEYSLQSDFSGEVGSYLYNNTSSSTNTYVSLSLTTYPLNQYQTIYFRVNNICSGSNSSSYSNILDYECLEPLPPILTLFPVWLRRGNVCNHGVNRRYWVDTELEFFSGSGDFLGANQLYKSNNIFDPAIEDFYNNGLSNRYWTGTSFVEAEPCYLI